MVEMLVHHLNILPYSLPFLSDFIIFAIILRNTIYGNLGHIRKHSDKYIFYTLRFDCSFAAANTIKPQLL